MSISACWIAKNEGKNIARSIESVLTIADELIVVDTGSTDDTVAVAESMGARVEYFEWIGDFSAARNHAISLCSGDFIIHLDADEFFNPALKPQDRDAITNIFRDNPGASAIVSVINNIDRTTGASIQKTMVNRIFRNRPSLRYVNKIHEFLMDDAGMNTVYIRDAFTIDHTGYSREVIDQKLERNFTLLEEEIRHFDKGSNDYVRTLMYLTRESFYRKNYEKNTGYLRELFEYPGVARRICRLHGAPMITILYAVFEAAINNRSAVSREEIRRRWIPLFKESFPDYPGTAEIDLFYQANFDNRENLLLPETESAIAAERPYHPVSSYREYENGICEKAALAAWRRGEPLKALDLTARALGGNGYKRPNLLYILLGAVKGQPSGDIIALLNSLYHVSDPADLGYLISGTRIDGFTEVHTYYLKKRLDLNPADLDDFMTLMLLHKRYDALAAAVRQAESPVDLSDNISVTGATVNQISVPSPWSGYAARYLFVSALCGAPQELLAEYADLLTPYRSVLDAFRAGERLAEPSPDELELLRGTFDMVALAGGMDTADRYLEVFRASPRSCYLNKAIYCETSGLAERLLRERMEGIDPLDFVCWRYQIQAMIHAGLYEDALTKIQEFLTAENLDHELLHMLLVVAEKAPSAAGAARALYDRYIEIFDAVIDLNDVVKTGVVFDDGGARQKKALKAMTRAQFAKYAEEESGRPATKELLRLYREAAGVYREKGVLGEAVRCLVRAVVRGGPEAGDYESLAETFEGLRNDVLPAYFREKAAKL